MKCKMPTCGHIHYVAIRIREKKKKTERTHTNQYIHTYAMINNILVSCNASVDMCPVFLIESGHPKI